MSKFSIDLETLYRETDNPLYVWAAVADYAACPDGAPLPAWIMAYLREAAMNLEMLADDAPPGAAVGKVNAALRLTGTGRNAFAEYRLIARADASAFIDDRRTILWRARDGKSRAAGKQSKAWLAKSMGVDGRTIGNWIKRIRELRAAPKGK